jgi:hypothetical protein
VRILLDECVNVGVKAAIPGHAVKTVSETGWRGKTLKLGFVVARVPSNEIGSYRPNFAELQKAVESVRRVK